MQIITETELVDRIREFLDRHAMAPTTFGRKATGNANLIKELEDGKSPSLRTARKIATFMAETDSAAQLKAKLNAPIERPPGDEKDQQLPFSLAPVNPTGASSPTCSPTAGHPPLREANGSCPSCSETEA